MAKNIEGVIEAILGSLVCIGGSIITVAACGGHQEIDPQNYVQQAMIYGGLIICGVGAALVELGGRKFDRENRKYDQENNRDNQYPHAH